MTKQRKQSEIKRKTCLKCKSASCNGCNFAGVGYAVSDLTTRHRAGIAAIQETLEMGLVPTQLEISKRIKKSLATACRLLNELERMGFIESDSASQPIIYKISEKGNTAVGVMATPKHALQEYSGTDGPEFAEGATRAHNFKVHVGFHRRPQDKEMEKAHFEFDNAMGWPRYKAVDARGIKIHVTPKGIIIYLPEIWAQGIDEAEEKAGRIIQEVLQGFLKKFPSTVFGDVDAEERTANVRAVILQRHLALFLDPLAVRLQEKGVTIRTPRYEADASVGEPELEFVHRQHARDDAAQYEEMLDDVIGGGWSKMRDSVTHGIPALLQLMRLSNERASVDAARMAAVNERLEALVQLQEERAFSEMRMEAEESLRDVSTIREAWVQPAPEREDSFI